MKQLYEPDWDALKKDRPIVFIWIPKTGGTSASKMIKNNKYPILVGGTWMKPPTGEHASYTDVEEKVERRDIWRGKKATIVTVVRNPYDWLVSYFHHHSMPGRQSGQSWGQESTLGSWTTFKDFLSKFDSEYSTAGATLPRFMWGEGFLTEQLYNNQNVCKADVIITVSYTHLTLPTKA